MEEKKENKGRPKKEMKRTKIVSVRYSEPEFYMVEKNAGMMKKELSVFIRQSSLSSKILFTITDEDRTHIRKLIRMANNLNQLTKIAHNQNLLSLIQELISLRNDINSIIKKINP